MALRLHSAFDLGLVRVLAPLTGIAPLTCIAPFTCMAPLTCAALTCIAVGCDISSKPTRPIGTDAGQLGSRSSGGGGTGTTSGPVVATDRLQLDADVQPTSRTNDAGSVVSTHDWADGALDASPAPAWTFDSGVNPYDDFSRGERLVIPQDVNHVVTLDIGGSFPPEARPVSTWQLLDDDNLPREYELNITGNYLYADSYSTADGVRCRPSPGVLYGRFEVESVDVQEDINEDGAHLRVARDGDELRLTHNGVGSHELLVRGTFVADDPNACPDLTDEDGRVVLEYTTIVEIVRASTVATNLDLHCGEQPVMLSGRGFPGLDLQLFNAGGLFLTPHNVGGVPLELTIETEKEARIEGTEAIWRDGISITGERQRVRLSTKFGTLATYDLVEVGDINSWEVQFWSAEAASWKAEQTPIVPQGDSPVACTGRVLGADVFVTIDGRDICSPIFLTDFEVTHTTPEACEAAPHESDLGFPGALTMLTGQGTCELDLRFPAANQGEGLHSHLSATFLAR